MNKRSPWADQQKKSEKSRNPTAFAGFEELYGFSTTAPSEGFRVNTKIRQQLAQRKRQIQRRLDKFDLHGFEQPMFTARNIHYEISDKAQGIAHGGIGAIHALARQSGLIDAIDRRLVKFKIHLPGIPHEKWTQG